MTPRLSSVAAPDGQVGFRAALRDRTFLGLFLAEAQSAIGDQLARVALAVLVFRSTGSVSATAGVYAATLFPAVLGGVLLGRLGDRFSRRKLMIGVDLLRAAALVAMGAAALPIPAMVALVVFAVALGPVFSAAQVSTLAARMSPEMFRAANGLRLVVSQATQVAGFLLGGVVVAFVGPGFALVLDGVTFVASAVLVTAATMRVRPRPAVGAVGAQVSGDSGADVADETASQDESTPAAAFEGIWRDLRLRKLAILTLLAGVFVVPEGLAVPYGRAGGASTTQIGALFAAGAAGGAIGAVLVVRLRRRMAKERMCAWLAVCCGLPLLGTGLTADWRVAAVLWFASGVCSAYMVDATTLVVQAIPDQRRASLVGVLSALVLASQGAGLLVFGVVAQWTTPGLAITAAGGLGSLAALTTMVLRDRSVARSVGVSPEPAPTHPATVSSEMRDLAEKDDRAAERRSEPSSIFG